MKSLKVLVSAFNFSPIQGTEFATGWDHVRAIAARNRVWVLARTNEQEETERYFQTHPKVALNLTVKFIPFTTMDFDFPFWELPYYRHYRQWQIEALKVARALDAEIGFDLVQHITGTGYREPGFLWRLGKPFVWGPVGGMQYFPVRLLNVVPFRARPFFVLKNVLTFFSMHFSYRPRIASSKAVAILAGTSESADRISAIWSKQATVMNEVHSPTCGKPPVRRNPNQAFRIVWSGRFQPRKALNIVLRALERLKDAPFAWELVCLGSGERLPAWTQLAADLGIADRCRFLGSLPRADALDVMGSGHCFAQPSLYDATTSVVLEALAVGLPVICLDHCGFRDVVKPDYGVRIPPNSLPQILSGFADAFTRLAVDEESRYRMAVAAQAASEKYTWKAKAVRLNNLYEELFPDLERAGGILKNELAAID